MTTTELYIFREGRNVYISTNKPYYDEAMGYIWGCGTDYDTIGHSSIFEDLEEGVLYKWNGSIEPIENKGGSNFMTGEDLIRVISESDRLRFGDVKETIKTLLKARLINPSTLIDAQVAILEDEKYKLKCHFEDSVVSTIQLFSGNFKGKDYEKAKKRLAYNTSFSKCFPNMTTTYDENELEFLVPDDYWTRLEHTYAGMAMQGMMAHTNIDYDEIVDLCVEFAHALVEKYKKEEK